MKKVKVLIERAADGSYSAYMEDVMQLPYCLNGVGRTAQEAMDDWERCYAEMRDLFASEGREFLPAEFVYAFDVPSFLLYYGSKFTFAGLSRLTGVSAAQLSQYAGGYRRPSPKTTAKIQRSLRAFGDELSRLQLV